MLPVAFARGTAVAAFIAVGLVDSSHGVVWPSLRTDLGLPVADLAVLTSVLAIGYGSSSAASGSLGRRWSPPGMLGRAWAAGALGLALCALSPAPAVLVGGVLVLGLAGGLIDAGVQAQAARSGGLRLQGAIHAAYGAGAAAGPLLFGIVLAAGASWRTVYGSLCVLDAVMLGAVLLRPQQWWSPPPAGEPAQGAEQVTAQVRLRLRDELPALGGFAAVTALESASFAWLFTFLREGRDLSTGTAGSLTALFGVAYTAPRLVLMAAGHRVTPPLVLRGGLLVSGAGFAVSILGTSAVGLTLLIAGLGVGALYPALMATTASRVHALHLDTAVGHQVAAATLGAGAGAALPGVLLAHSGVSAYPEAMLALSVVTAAFCLRLVR